VESEQRLAKHSDDEIDLRELFSVLWAGKRLIVGITAVFALVAVFYALSIPNQYRATVVLAPAQSDGGGLSGALAQLGGLASLAGVNIPKGDLSESQIAQQVMRSWNFVDNFINRNDLYVDLYASEGWNQQTNLLVIDEDKYDFETKMWLLEDDNGVLSPPSSWDLYEAFSERLSISEDDETGLVSVSFEFYSPEIAKIWLDMLIESVNIHMQQRQVSKVANNIQYLKDQVSQTSIAEMQAAFYSLIEEQIKSKMLAEASPEYAFVTVSPAMVPEEKSRPKRALICVLGTLLGGILSVLWVLSRYFLKID